MVIGIDNINLSDCHKFYCILAIWKRVDVILTFRACTYFSTTSSYVSLRLSMNYTSSNGLTALPQNPRRRPLARGCRVVRGFSAKQLG